MWSLRVKEQLGARSSFKASPLAEAYKRIHDPLRGTSSK